MDHTKSSLQLTGKGKKNLLRAQSVSLRQRGEFTEDYIRFDAADIQLKTCQWIYDTKDFCGREAMSSKFPYCRFHLPRAVTKCASQAIEDWIDRVLAGTVKPLPDELL